MQGVLMITIRQAIMFTILVMVIDKMLAVSRPLKYKHIFTYKVAVVSTTVTVVLQWCNSVIHIVLQ